MKILILGGNRYFGLRLARKLANNYEVTLLNRQSHDDGLGGVVKRIKCDRTDKRALFAAASRNYDVIYDQICYEPQQARDAIEIFAPRTGRYIFTSSMSAYSDQGFLPEEKFDPTSYKFTEDSKDYAEAKRQCEAVFFQQEKLKTLAIRFPIVCGPDDYTKRLMWHVEHVAESKPMFFPNIEAKLSLIHSEDAANILAKLATETFTGPLNVCSKEPIALKTLVNKIEEKTGKKAVFGGNDHSPYGIDNDWYMATEKLEQLGLRARPIYEWLPELL